MSDSDELANPYVGPKPFEAGRPLFGRDREVAALSYMLTSERIVLLHSPSGAGKSSLIQAGLLPRLAGRFDVWGPTRVNQTPPKGVENRYVWSVTAGLEKSDSFPQMTLAEYARQRPRHGNPLILFDQFEEVLRLDPVDVVGKRVFFEQLGEMLRDPGIWALFVLREDYLAPLDIYRKLLPTGLQNRYRIDRLTRDAAVQAIVKPIANTLRHFAPDVAEKLAEDLARVKLQQADGSFREEAGVYVEPLQLQVVCFDLWDRLGPYDRVIGSDQIGDVGDALSGYYVKSVQSVANGNQVAERWVRDWFQNKLLTPDGVRNQIRHGATESGGLNNDLVSRLVDTHLVRAESRGGSIWYELSHDRLIEPIVLNNALWISAHLNRAEQRALQWEREGRPDGLLLQGNQLMAARRWAADPASTTTEGDLLFLAASAQKRRKILQLRCAVGVLIAFLIGTSALGVVVRRERDRAQLNLLLAQQAVDQSLSSAGRQQARESSDPPEMEAFRKELLDKAAAFYTVFSKEDSSDPRIRKDSAAAHARLGDIDRLLDRPEDAVREYGQAIDIFAALGSDYPEQAEYQRWLAYCHNWLGETLRLWLERSEAPDAARRSAAKSEYDEALRLQQRIHLVAPQDNMATQELARTYYNRGILEYDADDRGASEADVREAIELLEPIPESSHGGLQNGPEATQELARSYNNLAGLLKLDGKTDEAKALFEKAIALVGRLSAANPTNREYKYELGQYCDNEARLLTALNRSEAAAVRSSQSLHLMEELAAPSPSLRLEQLKVHQLRSEILLDSGSPNAKEESDRERDLLLKFQSGARPDHQQLLQVIASNLAINYVELATREMKAGAYVEAQDSVRSLTHLLPELPANERAEAHRNAEKLNHELSFKTARNP